MFNVLMKIFSVVSKVFKIQKDKAPKMNYELVANTATCINALTISDLHVEYVIMTLEAQGWKIDRKEVRRHFHTWTESDEGNKAIRQ